MTELSKEAINKLVALSQIELTEEEKESLPSDLVKMINYVELLNNLDTEGVVPCHYVVEEQMEPIRDDIEGETLSREEFLRGAPEHIGGMVRVPTVIKGNER
ncbi:Asp-tRNA(Asn)/Glu-tRNA(Gln) amidotransferase subunit GatC [Simkania negevensis]|uniref:Aspartyl/glutamyl-tRNA(Asn/Gln) amidotransferase subunit C n=1 Tax=Simkania negevensis TaxID=83561 RepID=A0ABS3AQX5_9BACT|nr:Asp-tRNA(Asn)/Glu-tRNA(Gln) amidotransferase subunit GatC [Simkania negevensis]